MEAPEGVRVSAATLDRIAAREAALNSASDPAAAARNAKAQLSRTAATAVSEADVNRLAFTAQICALAAAGKQSAPEEPEPDHAVGARCEVVPGGRRGTVRFVGRPGGVPRPLIAVELDFPQGDDTMTGGTWLDGQSYFEPARAGAAVVWKQPSEVVCGDFPEEDPFADLEDSDA
eukprot:TRINITY_DN38585_c0_g1_i1.p1 TRINITY_DN38585_c0_g1~~TRINITY_DN38585_c0_g1_i1.p1  ORF type:complete len:175 (-),score=47.88 TRINITY_DN38585_c0_g1_i1:82-606(-)